MLKQLSSLVGICLTCIFILIGSELSVRGQLVSGMLPYSESKKASNPSVTRLGTKASRAESEFKKAIDAGNTARTSYDYGSALANYLRASQLLPNDARGHYGLGNVYSDVHCYDSAIGFYSRALKIKSDYLDALMQLGNAYLNKERYDEAEAQFTQAINIQPRNVSARLARFYVWAKKRKYQEAIEGINQILNDKATSNNDRALANIALGNVLVAQDKWEESIVPFEKATQLSPDLAEAFVRLGMSQLTAAFSKEPSLVDITMEDKQKLVFSARQASDTLRTAIDVKHYEHPVAHLLLGMALTYQANYQAAAERIEIYLKRIKDVQARLSGLDPAVLQKCDYAWGKLFAYGYGQLGVVYDRQADEPGANRDELLNQAMQQYREAIKSSENYANGYTGLGTIYMKQKKYREAIEEYKRALVYQTTDSRRASTNGVIGTLHSQLGQNEEAIRYLNTAISLNSGDSGTYVSLATIYNRQGNYEEAIRQFTKAKEIERPPKASLYFMLAIAYFNRAVKTSNDADHEEAIKLLNEALRINSRFAFAYKALGNVYKFYKNGLNVEAALKNYELAKSYDSSDAGIYFLIGDLHASVTRNYDAAIKNLNEAIRLKPDYALAYGTLGIVYRDRKEDAEAIRMFLEALKYRKETDTYFLLANTYDHQKNYAEAIKSMQEGARNDPENHLPYYHIARFYTHWRKNDDAIHYYNEAINRLKSDDASTKNLYLCRIVRLRRKYDDALACFQKLTHPMADQVPYEIGATYVEAGNKQAALAQHQRLVELKSNLAGYLLEEINAMKQDK